MAITTQGAQVFVRFALAGGAAAAANWIAGRLLEPLTGLDASIVLAYGVGMITAFVLNKVFVFDKSGRAAGEEFARFALVNVLAVGIVWSVTALLARVVFPAVNFNWHADAVAHAVGICAPILPSFLLHRAFSFAAAARSADGGAS
jgi:putative flippase GtrA